MEDKVAINKEELSAELWNQWVYHPMTKVMFEIIKQQKENFQKNLYQQVGNPQIDDKFIRNTVYGMKCFDTMLITLQSYQLFLAEINKTQQ